MEEASGPFQRCLNLMPARTPASAHWQSTTLSAKSAQVLANQQWKVLATQQWKVQATQQWKQLSPHSVSAEPLLSHQRRPLRRMEAYFSLGSTRSKVLMTFTTTKKRTKIGWQDFLYQLPVYGAYNSQKIDVLPRFSLSS